MMLAYSLVFDCLREPDAEDDPFYCHSQFVLLTVRIALERRPGKLLAWPLGLYSFFLKLVDFGSNCQGAPKEAPSLPTDAVMQTGTPLFSVPVVARMTAG